VKCIDLKSVKAEVQVQATKYNTSSYFYSEAICTWIDYDEGVFSIHETYDQLNLLFDLLTNIKKKV